MWLPTLPRPTLPPPPPTHTHAQISPTALRGTLGSINQLCICLGILAALLVNVVLPAAAWRSMFAMSAAPAVLLALGAQVAVYWAVCGAV